MGYFGFLPLLGGALPWHQPTCLEGPAGFLALLLPTSLHVGEASASLH